MTPPDHAGDDPVPHAGAGSQGLSTARLTGLLNGTYVPRGSQPPLLPYPQNPPRTVVTTMQTGHGFAITGTVASSNLNDTSDFAIGSQSAKLTTLGNGASVGFRQTGLPAVDLSASVVELLFKVDDWTHVSAVQLYAGDTSFANFDVYVTGSKTAGLPYAGGEWVRIRLNRRSAATTGTPNRAAVTDWQLKIVDDNTGNAATLHFGGLWVVPKASQFPNGVVTFSFDDTWKTHITAARAYLDRYAFQATAFTIADAVGTTNHMSLADLQAMRDYSGWEIAGHALTTANHNAGFDTLSAPVLDAELRGLKDWLWSNGFNSEHFAYPLGHWSNGVDAAAQRYFATGRLINEIPQQTLPPTNPMRIRAVGLGSGTTLGSVSPLIDDAYTYGGWLVIVAHEVTTTPIGGTYVTPTVFQQIADYVKTKGIPVRTMGEVIRALA